MVKDDVVIIDVGITHIPDESRERDYYITGSVDFENVSKKRVTSLQFQVVKVL
jgi:methylenetetrahydrofolate dehydrogenase (NADP+)/methenyltetrahydrofolate cyclohydrolase